ncbi:MAG: HAMP domain-containing histidine kinase [Elusimicrobiota bacterium]|nr:MAG: HAMP domain-containing histidine kinase [Elusimicrobiota bacterium]
MDTKVKNAGRANAPNQAAPFSVSRIAVTAVIIFGTWQLIYHWLFMVMIPMPGMLASHLANLLVASVGTALITTYCVHILRGLNLRLQESDWQKNLLTQAIVHDLRQPLSAMLAGLKALREEDSLSPEERKLLLATAQSSSSRLLEMTNDLLDISGLEEGQPLVALRETEPEKFIEEGARILAPLAAANGQALKVSLPGRLPPVSGDEDRLRRVVTNLVGNALKFTPRGGTILVAATHDAGRSELRVSVADTGPGVPVELRPRLFEKFARIAREQRGGRASMGMGLYFCKVVVEAHGGRIWFESGREGGATFIFSIPAARRHEKPGG